MSIMVPWRRITHVVTLDELKSYSVIMLNFHDVYLSEKTSDTVTITGNCMFYLDKIEIKNVPWQGLLDWLNGTSIQDALPELSIDDREFLISGTGPTYWKPLIESDRAQNTYN